MSSAFLSRPGSTLGERVVALVERELGARECFLLDPGAPVRVEDRSVLWGGKRLDTLDALVVEAPLVPWPQPVAEARQGEPVAEHQQRGFAARERRALRASALRLLADRVRVANDPARVTELAYSAAVALERLEQAKVPVRPWRLRPEAGGEAGWSVAPLVAELAAEIHPGPSLEIELASRPARAHLCVGGAWISSAEPQPSFAPHVARSSAEPPAAERELACAALAALGLDFGSVHVCAGAVALVSAAPDLEAWDRAADGRVAHALAALLSAPLLTSPRTAVLTP